ncbi:hypothetical protein I6N95_15605 [Vagococcus sp. BWB3-3]|uniref:Uncharacterized protein n=1 Tax=Vagococcus allomyrinae TaxID=2794353 RepID=A0A940PCI4_9ENTE|nr:hypothetical protein [Vagococcus allomyrinae]MBP1042444.1 hypothetical protein [Vagococcus allomyrinae]
MEIFDDEFEPNDNHIRVIFGLLRDITEEERAFLLSFMESLLSFKPSIDYRVEYVEVANELEFDYPEEKGFVQLVNQVNSLFDVTIQITDYSSFNNLIQN